MRQGKILLVAAIGAFAIVMVMSALARAEDKNVPIDCPKGALSCKVVIMTDQEIQTLQGAGLIFDSAEWANRANLSAAIAAWKNKIASAPNGHVVSNESPKSSDPVPLPPKKPK